MISKELQELISSANDAVSNMLSSTANSSDPKLVKKSKLLAYWLRDYMRLLKKEETFLPTKLKRYKRGDIIQLHLGFNLGSEEGGLHYAVVISTYNSNSSDTLTIIPLSSKKSNYKPSPYTLDLGNVLYDQLSIKYQNLQNDIQQKISTYTIQKNDLEAVFFEKTKELQSLPEDEGLEKLPELSMTLLQLDSVNKELSKLTDSLNTIKKMQSEVLHLKHGSIALVSQITTISKIRIYNPLNKQDLLSSIKLTPDHMDMIDKKVVELYTHTK